MCLANMNLSILLAVIIPIAAPRLGGCIACCAAAFKPGGKTFPFPWSWKRSGLKQEMYDHEYVKRYIIIIPIYFYGYFYAGVPVVVVPRDLEEVARNLRYWALTQFLSVQVQHYWNWHFPNYYEEPLQQVGFARADYYWQLTSAVGSIGRFCCYSIIGKSGINNFKAFIVLYPMF